MLSIEDPGGIYGATGPTARNLLQLLNEEGQSLSSRHPWQSLTKEKTFTTVAAAAQTSSIATDFLYMIPESMFNRDTMRRINGPISPAEWQEVQATVTTFVNPVFRIQEDTIKIYPTPTADQTVAYEYVSKNWVNAATDASEITADSNTFFLDERLLILGLVWRFKAAHGMDAAADRQAYEVRVRDAIIRDGSRQRLSSDPGVYDRVPRAPVMPETLTGL